MKNNNSPSHSKVNLNVFFFSLGGGGYCNYLGGEIQSANSQFFITSFIY